MVLVFTAISLPILPAPCHMKMTPRITIAHVVKLYLFIYLFINNHSFIYNFCASQTYPPWNWAEVLGDAFAVENEILAGLDPVYKFIFCKSSLLWLHKDDRRFTTTFK